MKRSIAFTIALAVGVLSLALLSSDSTARAQGQNKFTWDTGVVTLGPNQILRITVASGEPGIHEVLFRFIWYDQGICNAGVCTHQVSLEVPSLPVSLTQNEAASFDIPNIGAGGLRGIVASKRPDLRVNGCIIDTLTGATVGCYVVQSGPSA